MAEQDRGALVDKIVSEMTRGVCLCCSPSFAADARRRAERLVDEIIPPPPAPDVVVTEEAYNAYHDGYSYNDRNSCNPGQRTSRESGLRAAFPHLLAANPWAVDAEIRLRVEKLPNASSFGRQWASVDTVSVRRDHLLTALGVTTTP